MTAYPHLKPIEDQVIVITGATSGIGLTTARLAARRGARLVLAARNAKALDTVVGELRAAGAKAVGVEADVGEAHDVERIGAVAIDVFGRIDSWVNNAGVGLYGEFDKVSEQDQRRLFDTNYWGVFYGAREAVRRIKGPGAIINIGSVLSDVPMPLQSTYTASKHAVKGLTDTIRIEVEKRGRPIAVTLVKPAAIDTPFADHARSHDKAAPATPPPRYAPELVAETIIYACENPVRETFVGGAAPAMRQMWRSAPDAYDWVAKTFLYGQQRQRKTADIAPARDNLYAPRQDGAERSQGPSGGSGRAFSLYQTAALNPGAGAAVATAVAAGVALAWALRRGGAGGSALLSQEEGVRRRAHQQTGARSDFQSEPANIPSVS